MPRSSEGDSSPIAKLRWVCKLLRCTRTCAALRSVGQVGSANRSNAHVGRDRRRRVAEYFISGACAVADVVEVATAEDGKRGVRPAFRMSAEQSAFVPSRLTICGPQVCSTFTSHTCFYSCAVVAKESSSLLTDQSANHRYIVGCPQHIYVFVMACRKTPKQDVLASELAPADICAPLH